MASQGILSRNARRFREDRGLSILSVAHRSGLSKQTVINIESGLGNPTVSTLETLAGCLGVSVRALLSELGTEVVVNRGDSISWRTQGTLQVRPLDQAFGSGYVYNAMLRLELNRAPALLDAAPRGALRHCLLVQGTARIGPVTAPVTVTVNDFVRFPADEAHTFEAVTPIALIFVCTTAPQLSTVDSERFF